MQLPKNHTGSVLAVFSTGDHKNPIVDVVEISKGYYGDSFSIAYKGNVLSDTLEYESRLDTYQHPSDDGEQDYVLAHILSLDTNAPKPETINAQNARQTAMPLLMAAMEEMSKGNMHSSDFAWANRILTYPAWLHATWQLQGQNVEAAQKHIASSVFGLSA